MKVIFLTDYRALARLFSLALLLWGAQAATAQVIAWKPAEGIRGDQDISHAGTFVDAIQAYAGSNVQGSGKPAAAFVAGDTTFRALTGSGKSIGSERITLSSLSDLSFFNSNRTAVPSNQFNSFPTGTGVTDGYSAIVSNGAFFNSGPIGSITLKGLTPGRIYQVQIWGFVQDGAKSLTSFSDDFDNAAVIDAAANVPKSGALEAGKSYGQFVIGVFQAITNTASIAWGAGEGSPYPLISAVALRDVTTVPEAVQAIAAKKKAAATRTVLKSPPGFEGIDVWKDLTYTRVNHHSLKLDLYIPQNAHRPMPLIVYIHGGGWSALDKTEGLANGILQHGFALACIDYRFSQEAVFPAQTQDCKAAVRWLRAHASEFGYNPNKIGAWGDSAGGHLVSMLGLTANNPELEGTEGNPGVSSQVQAVCDYYGPSNMLTMDPKVADAAVPRLIGGPIDQNVDKARKASPIFYVTGRACPFLIVQGDSDPIVPPQQSIDLHNALKKAGVDSTLYIVKGGGHGFGDPKAFETVVQFFNKHLK
ncbi:MAG TPA: alpha/beta hydrolase [Chthoniobacterales bacterium]|nr:alpha/beta hydrolase [Chthoniobacterales bacterium]